MTVSISESYRTHTRQLQNALDRVYTDQSPRTARELVNLFAAAQQSFRKTGDKELYQLYTSLYEEVSEAVFSVAKQYRWRFVRELISTYDPVSPDTQDPAGSAVVSNVVARLCIWSRLESSIHTIPPSALEYLWALDYNGSDFVRENAFHAGWGIDHPSVDYIPDLIARARVDPDWVRVVLKQGFFANQDVASSVFAEVLRSDQVATASPVSDGDDDISCLHFLALAVQSADHGFQNESVPLPKGFDLPSKDSLCLEWRSEARSRVETVLTELGLIADDSDRLVSIPDANS